MIALLIILILLCLLVPGFTSVRLMHSGALGLVLLIILIVLLVRAL